MADSSAQADIRGIDIQKLVTGFSEEEFTFKKLCTVTPTSAREIRWYQKTSGILATTLPTTLSNVAELAQPFVLEQSWTRNTSYVRKYFVESPMLSDEDIKDSDIDILATNINDLTRAVAAKVDARIYDIITESQTPVNINSVTSSGAWSTPNFAIAIDPIRDLLSAKQKIREASYNPEGARLLLTPAAHTNLINWLISIKGSSIPAFSSQKIESGVVMEILGLQVSVSTNVVASGACVVVPQRAVTWKSFVPITARTVDEVGIGTKIRVWEEGEGLLTDPKAVSFIFPV